MALLNKNQKNLDRQMEKAKKILMTKLRDKTISRAEFRKVANQLAYILAHEAMEHLQTKKVTIETPLEKTTGEKISDEIVLVPILRSGITMVETFLYYFENAAVGVVGLKRDEKTAQAHWYYENLPAISQNTQVIILDPMLATGGTACEILKKLQKQGASLKKTIFVSMVCAPEGLEKVRAEFPEVKIITAAVDEKLNKEKFILPGLGDFGDRYFGTE